jgi:hypothetical protein
MELPNDVWDIIVKKSLKTNEEIIKDKTYYELSHLMSEIKLRQRQIIRDIKKQFNKYDIVEVSYGENFKTTIIIRDLCGNEEYINGSSLTLLNDTTKTIMGQDYINCFRGGKTNIKNIKLKLISTEEERKNKNIEIANTLKVGDRFCYSIASVPQYLKYYYHYGDRINDLNREGIVRFTTKCKVYVDIYGYIDKSKVLYSF